MDSANLAVRFFLSNHELPGNTLSQGEKVFPADIDSSLLSLMITFLLHFFSLKTCGLFFS